MSDHPSPTSAEVLASLVTHYQPIWDLTAKKIIGFEGLTRAQHQGALVAPDAFIPGLLDDNLGWQMDTAVLQRVAADISTLGSKFSHKIFFVNLFRTSFHDPRLLTDLLLRYSGAQDIKVCIEICEKGEPLVHTHAVVGLRELGTLLAFDDYEPRYFSHEELGRIQPEFIKIKWSVLNGPAQEEIQTILKSIDRQRTEVIIEGIETERDFEAARNAGFHLIQGFYCFRPQPLDQIMALPDHLF